MRIVLQRVKHAAVVVDNEVVGKISRGLLLLVGAQKGDTVKQAEYLAEKCVGLRIFEDDNDKMNLALKDVSGEALVVSQFTLCADISKGRRPSFANAMPPDEAEALYEKFCSFITAKGVNIQTGRFAAKMAVELTNDGPVTIILEN
ncbi:MAG: D-tyrosyl-tRNA(Tyr) deacylase [candidate division Zixibacteria bacterium]|nr:D-tyrosyl-tRNA(Tyr) deacylase [candidate division Zixibacteria bacterium]